MNQTKVSIILPVHNSKTYLKQCIESAMNQTFKEIEIICVCGSGNDGSDALVEEYQKKDSRIIKIVDVNGSYGHKLNIGTKASRGEYIAILETDDYLEKTMVEELYITAMKEKVDFVDADYYEFFEIDNCEYKIIHNKYMDSDVYNRKLYAKDARMSVILSDITANWTGLYKKDFLIKKNLFYNESPGASYQDLGFRYLLACLVDTTYHVNKSLYHYRTDNENSSVKDMKKIFVVQKEYEYIFNQMKKKNILQKYLWDYYYIWKYRDYFWNVQRLQGDGRAAFLQLYRKELLNDIQNGNINQEIIEPRYENCIKKPIDESVDFNSVLNEISVTTAGKMEKLVEIVKKCKDKRIVICGCGVRGKNVNVLLEKENVLCMCDENPDLLGTFIGNRKVISYDDAVNRFPDSMFVVANRFYSKEVVKKLEILGIKREKMVLYD